MPYYAHKLMPDGSVNDVPLSQLAVDDKVLIKPGEKAPADGVIVEGESSVNEAMLTGESTPVTRTTGGKVIGGSINGEGSLTEINKQYQQPSTKEHDHERDEIRDQRPYLRNDRGRSNRDPRRARWKDVLLLQRTLSAEVSVHARRCGAGGRVWILLWIMSTLTSPAVVTRNEFANTAVTVTAKQAKTKTKGTVVKMVHRQMKCAVTFVHYMCWH